MIRTLRLLPLVFLPACAMTPPAPPAPALPPTPVAQFFIPPGTEFASELFGYSQAVRVGPWITVSAAPGFDIQKRGFPEAYADQVRAAFTNLQLVIEASGASMNDVIEITTYQLDMDKFNETVDGKNAVFGAHRPTWTAVGVKSLPLPSMQIQVSARAYTLNPPATGEYPAVVPAPVPAAAPAAGSAPAVAPVAAPAPAAPGKPVEQKKKPPERFMNRPGY